MGSHVTVLWYLRVNREILHRDISKGNVLYTKETTLPPDTGSRVATMTEVRLGFTYVRLNIALILGRRRFF